LRSFPLKQENYILGNGARSWRWSRYTNE